MLAGLCIVSANLASAGESVLPRVGACGPMSTGFSEEPGAPYYTIDLVPTGRVPGTRTAVGAARVMFERSPFGLSVTATGRYAYAVEVGFRGLRPRGGDYVVWITNADLSSVQRAGVLDEASQLATEVDWNKFLVVVTLERAGADPEAASWNGPIVFRGMSRSGRMHTMAGHGPFQAEPCAKYGY